MKLRILLGLVVLILGYFVVRPRLTPIGGGWAIGRSPLGSQSLMRVADRTTVSRGVIAYQFYKPDCVVYTASSSFDGKVYLAACGDRTPVSVEEAYFKTTPFGLRYVLKHDTFDTVEKTIERHIPIGRILAAAKKARPYSSSLVPRIGPWRRMEITYARYPVGIEEMNEAQHTAVHDAVTNGCVALLNSWLAQGVFPDLLDEKGVTPLMYTVIMQADTGLAQVLADTLLRSGADVDAQANNGMTALMYAKRANAMITYQLLIDWGADSTLTHAGGEKASDMQPVAGYDALSRRPRSTTEPLCPAEP